VTIGGALLRGSLEDTNTPLTASSLLDWVGGGPTAAGVRVTERRVYGLPAYYRAIAVTAGTLAGLPVKVYRAGTRERVHQQTVIDNPNPRQTPFEFRFSLYANALSWGNGFAFKIRNAADVVTETWLIHPSRVDVIEVHPTPANPAGKLFRVTFFDGVSGLFTPWDVFHLPYMSLDGVSGIRPLELFRQRLGIAIAAEETAAGFYGSGAMVSGILSTEQELTPTEAEALKRRWKAKVSGPHRAGDVAVLDRGAKFEKVALPPGDAQLLESQKFSVTEIARMIGTPPHLVMDVERSTSWGTGIEQQALGWVKFTLATWITASEQRYTRELLPGGWNQAAWYAESILEGLLRGDSKARAEFYRVLVAIGALSPAEVRDKENLEPVDGLDFYTVPKNMQVVDTAGDDASQEGTDDDQTDDQA